MFLSCLASIFILVLLLVTPAAARDLSLVSIKAPDAPAVQRIANIGVDIWSVHAGYITAAVSSDELGQIRALGYEVATLYASLADLERSVARPAVPQAVDYRNHAQVVAEMQRLASQYPEICKMYSLGTTYEGRTIWGLKITEKAHLQRSVPAVLFCGEHHAREWISVEVPLRLADYIVSQYAGDPAMQARLNQIEIWIVPMVNPDGYAYSWTTSRLWRKNRVPVGGGCYGVDPNRNYGYQWGMDSGSSPYPCADTYRGPYAFSEKETQAIRDLLLSREFFSLISYHNYSQLVMWPWGYTTNPTPDNATFVSLGQQMASIISMVHGVPYTPQQASALYLTSGDTDDWAYGALGIWAYTVELRPQGYPYYFQLPPDQIVPTFEENLPGAMHLLDWTRQQSPTSGIEVFTNLDSATFNITGAAQYSGSGRHWTRLDAPNGSYAISYGQLPGWIAPAPASGSVSSSLLTFEGNYSPDYKPLWQLKGLPDGQPAALQSKAVSAAFDGFFYVQDDDRMHGIRVNWAAPPAEGRRVNLVGTLTTASGERAINASWVQTVP